MVKMPGNINGGFYPGRRGVKDEGPSVVIALDDLDKAIKKVKKAGGRRLGRPVGIPGIGLYVSFKDSEENRASILQPVRM